LFVVRRLFRYGDGWNNGVIVRREIKELKMEENGMV
jgi:hypothetical protein